MTRQPTAGIPGMFDASGFAQRRLQRYLSESNSFPRATHAFRDGHVAPLPLASAHLERCGLCEHRCHVNRHARQRGPCKAGTEARVFRHRVEYGEELELIASYLFYLSGYDLRCTFCIAEENAFNPRIGSPHRRFF